MGGKDCDLFGYALSFSPDSSLLAIRSYQSGNNGTEYVNVYRVDKFTSAFTKLGGSLLGDKDGDTFGRSLILSPDSNLLAVGAVHGNNDGDQCTSMSTGLVNQNHYLYSLVTPMSVAKMVIILDGLFHFLQLSISWQLVLHNSFMMGQVVSTSTELME